MRTNVLRAAAALAVATFGLAGCGGGSSDAATPAPAPSATAAAATLTVKDPWVKAGAAGAMTAAFGTLVNDTGADITITTAESPASPLELHEMAMKDGKMVMQPKQGGFVIKSRGSHELSPGGDHLMLMKPAQAIEPGDEVSFTLKLGDGSTVPFTAIAKPFAGAEESYDPGHSMAPMGSTAP
ncbi:copper chaperone PCu(A)C [Actinoplanes sp. M2I2]|uniref:copper chaperone PCu(A)C n=1 Tax=Actinoplanes sp. M2I2 TaxID=1734444 RepID=UPI0020222EBC|nr:copper chaperone PCu(A)C [Actinoplanes sp. M2I2]